MDARYVITVDFPKFVFNTNIGTTGAKGDKGDPGQNGADGAKGDPGYSPVKGVDYWTQADINSMVSQAVTEVLERLPAAEGVNF